MIDSKTAAAIASSVLLIISEVLPFLPTQINGIVHGIVQIGRRITKREQLIQNA